MTNNILGIIWMLVHLLCAIMVSMYYRILSETFHPLQISFFYNFSAFLMVLPFIIKRRKKLIKSCFLWAHVFRGAFYVTAQIMLIFVYNHMPFAQVSAITMTYPLFATIGAVFFLKERIGIHRFIALIVGFIGAAIIINPDPQYFNKYSIFAVFSVILWVFFDMITNKVGGREDMWTQLLQLLMFIALFSILPITGTTFPTLHLKDIGCFAFMGFVIIMYMLSAVLAVSKSEVNIVVPFYFTALPISSLIGYVVFGERLELRTITGAIIIIISAIYIAYKEYQAKQIAKQLQQSRLI